MANTRSTGTVDLGAGSTINGVPIGGGGTPALSAVLGVGNTTGANDIIVSTGQRITSQTDLFLQAFVGSNPGNLQLWAGDSPDATPGGSIELLAGASDSGPGGSITISTYNQGDITLEAVDLALDNSYGTINIGNGGGNRVHIYTFNGSDLDPVDKGEIHLMIQGDTPQMLMRRNEFSLFTDTSAITIDGVTVGLRTNGLPRWSLTDTELAPVDDNAYDIGIDTSNRVRSIYAGTSVVVGGTVTVTTDTISGSDDLTVTAGNNDTLFLLAPGSSSNVQIHSYTITISGSGAVGSSLYLGEDTTQRIGFYGASPTTQLTVTGSRGGNAALADLLTQLATVGIIVDGTSA